MERPLCSLSDKETAFIRLEVKKCGISFSHLEDELIDHLCCLTEEYLNEGFSFEEAFKRVRKDIALDSLKDIEIQTLLLINKKLRAMKTTLKISGIAGLACIIIASVFKVLHWPGASILLTLGFLILAFAYIPVLAFALKKEKLLKRKRNLALTGMIAAFLFLISILFTIMHWSLREYIILLSWIIMLIFLIMLFVNIMRSEENRVLHLSLILFFTVLFVLDISIYLLNLNNPKVSRYTLEYNLRESVRLFEQGLDEKYMLLDSLVKPDQKEILGDLKTGTGEIIAESEDIRNKLFISKEEQEKYNRKFFKNQRMAYDLESDVMQLEKNLKHYKDFLLEKASASPHLKAFIEQNIRFGAYDFNNAPPILYNNLERLIRDTRIIENEFLDIIYAQYKDN